MRCAVALLVLVFTHRALAGEPAEAIRTESLHHVFRVADGLFSGNAPENEAAFRELVRLGVKTIVSVDGAKPRVDLAHRFGLRYVHLPIGYDGIAQARAEELARAAQAAGGPVYVHCHHGKHRGPAAAAVICRTLHGWSAEQAAAFLEQAGTAPEYAGLHRDVRAFRPPSVKVLAGRAADFPESAGTPPLVDAMVAVDALFDALKDAQDAAWRSVPRQPDLTPAQAAALVRETFREMARDPACEKRGAGFGEKLHTAEAAAAALERAVREPASGEGKESALRRVSESCTSCHAAHRN